jgi:Ca2+-binding RTX toxin-like protein
MIVVETMEGRRHFTATVTEGYPGFFEVLGDASADVISISVDQVNETFTLNDVTYTEVAYIFVNSGQGNDTVTLTAADFGYIATSVVSGAGDDIVNVDFDGSIWAGPGDDTVYLSDAFRGEVFGEGEDDQVFVSGYCVDAEVDGGNGNDLLDAFNNYYGVYMHGGKGDDILIGSEYGDTIWGGSGNDLVEAGGGDDTVYLVDGGPDTVDGGDGEDWLYADLEDQSVANVEHVG